MRSINRLVCCVLIVLFAGMVMASCSDVPAERNSPEAAETAENTALASETSAADTPEPEAGVIPVPHKALVAYFSATGNTREAAESIAEAIDGVLFEIVPAEPYTSEDLQYQDESTRATVEQHDESARPAIKSEPEDIRQYDVVYLGYPIWWGSAPRIIYTFLESNDLSGMKVVPFCTSGSTGISGSEEELRAQFPDIDWQPGERITGSDVNMAEWSDELGFWPFGDY